MFKAIGKYVRAILHVMSFGFIQKANEVYTNSEAGVRTAYTEARDQLIDQVKVLMNGVAGLESLKIEKENILKKLGEEEEEIVDVLEGILSQLEDDPENEELIRDYSTIDGRKDQINAREEVLEHEISDINSQLQDYDLEVKKYQDQVHALRQEEEEAVSDLSLSNIEKDLLERQTGLKKSVDMSAVEAVQKARRDNKAKVSTLRRAAGADTQKRMDKYKASGNASRRSEKLDSILAARKAKKAATEAGSSTEAAEVVSERKV